MVKAHAAFLRLVESSPNRGSNVHAEAVAFEEIALSVGSEFLPACAKRVLNDPDDVTAEYWEWLADEWRKAHEPIRNVLRRRGWTIL
jgi:hypothetical protein